MRSVTDWVAYDKGGQLAFGQLAALSAKSARLTSGEKVPLRRVWLSEMPQPSEELQSAASRLATTLSIEAIWRAAKGRNLSLPDLSAAVAAEADAAGEESADKESGVIWSIAVLRVILEKPFYFQRQGGLLHPQPPELLEKIAESRRQREQQQAAEANLLHTLAAGEMPPEMLAEAEELLYAPDKNSPSYRALKLHTGGSPAAIARFFITAGLLPDACAYWRGMFRRDWPDAAADDGCAPPPPLPVCSAAAFSIDDAGTVEIDDAFSIEELPGGDWRIGVHIAAPALSAPLMSAARRRLISVYFPDEKICMLPPSYVAAYSLAVGESRPAVSLYATYTPASGDWRVGETTVESVQLVAALSPAQVDGGEMSAEVTAAVEKLQIVTAALATEPPTVTRRITQPVTGGDFGDYKVTASPPFVSRRRRDGSAAVVAALMRLVNSVWARQLQDAKAGGLSRADGATKAIMPPGREPYMWFSSPLRRYADLANQRLLLAQLGCLPVTGCVPSPPKENWRSLAAAFDRRHMLARRFQQKMERHWALRGVMAAGDTPLAARHLGGGRVRLADYPLRGICKGGQLPAADSVISVRVREVDLVEQRLWLQPA